MAPPKFADLSKKFKDLAKDNFGFGETKVTIKTKTANGTAFKVEETRKFDTGAVFGLLEVKYTNAAHGLTIKDTLDSNSQVNAEIAVDNAALAGNKLTFNKAFNTGKSLFSGYKLKHEYATSQVNVENVFDGKTISASSVFQHDHLNLGALVAFDLQSSNIKDYSVAASLVYSDSVFTAAVSGPSVNVSVFHTPNVDTQVGVEVGYKTTGGDNTFNVVGKVQLNKDAFVKASLDKKLQLGLSYTQQVGSGISLTLASLIDSPNLSADAHKLGVALNFEN
jgi:voltage-dependent anion channel protein 2